MCSVADRELPESNVKGHYACNLTNGKRFLDNRKKNLG
jgi:hypothetical protein